MKPRPSAPDWLFNTVMDGLYLLSASGLTYAPPEDTADGTAAAWADAIWCAKGWSEGSMPALAEVLKHLPDTGPTHQLFLPELPKQKAHNLQRLGQIRRQLAERLNIRRKQARHEAPLT